MPRILPPLLLTLALLWLVVGGGFPLPRFHPDSREYIRHAPIRGPLYPALIQFFVPRGQSSLNEGPIEAAPYLPLIYFQVSLFALFLFLLLMLLCKGGVINLFLFALSVFLWGTLIDPHAFPWIQTYISSVMPEGLMPAWLCGLGVLSLLSLNRPRKLTHLSLGLLLYLGMELSPRLLPFGLLALLPLSHPKSRAKKENWLSVLLLGSLLVGRCGYNKIHYGIFAPAPFNGFASIGLALGLAEQGDETLFKDPKQQQFVAESLQDKNRKTRDWFVNDNVWDFALPHYRHVFFPNYAGPMNGIEMNRFFASTASPLLWKHKGTWSQWAVGRAFRYHLMEWKISLAVLTLLLVALRGGRHRAVVCVLCSIHLSNIACTIPFTDIVNRYLTTSSIALVLALTLSLNDYFFFISASRFSIMASKEGAG